MTNIKAAALVRALSEKRLHIATAESCTGGLISGAITSVPGSSDVFDGGVVSYANSVKNKLLGVSKETLDMYGAVSPQTACEMACGIAKLMSADIGISVTGIAGPGGGSSEKPVGLVYVGIHTKYETEAYKLNLSGNRDEIREKTVNTALETALSKVMIYK